MNEIPVYLFTGFYGQRKDNAYHRRPCLSDGFAIAGNEALSSACEDGDEEYYRRRA